MDLLDFEPGQMYFDEPLDARAEQLLQDAAEAYGTGDAEPLLQEARAIAPEHMSVLVALYRYYFYSHALGAALGVAAEALGLISRRLNLPEDWRDVSLDNIANTMAGQPELTRFYLNALKGAGYLYLRLGQPQDGLQRLDKVADLDPKDRLGARALAAVARTALDADAA